MDEKVKITYLPLETSNLFIEKYVCTKDLDIIEFLSTHKLSMKDIEKLLEKYKDKSTINLDSNGGWYWEYGGDSIAIMRDKFGNTRVPSIYSDNPRYSTYIEIKYKTYKDYILSILGRYQKLTQDFIAKYKDKVNWNDISKYQKLSESFIKKNKNRVNWYNIFRCQDLSESFMNKYINKLSYNDVFNILNVRFDSDLKKNIEFIRNYGIKKYGKESL